MKIIYILIFLGVSSFGQAQIDHFSEPSSKWYVTKVFANGSLEDAYNVDTITTIYGFEGDTLIEESTWLKMFSSQDSLFQESLVFEGYIKSENSIVEYFTPTLELDTLYNFSLIEGDSVFYDFGFDVPGYLDIIELISEEITAEMHSVFTFEEPIFGPFYVEEKWIEGIGSVHGPLFPVQAQVFQQELTDRLDLSCTYADDLSYFSNSSYDFCFANTSMSLAEIDNNTDLLYKIDGSEITISSARIITSVEVFSSFGQSLEEYLFNSPNFTFSISDREKGIYIIKIVFSNNHEKILKIYK